MRKDVRERIEMIKRGEVPEGYKKTKLGIIPDDWKICKIHQIADISSGSTPSRVNEEYWNGDIPWITTSEINNGYIVDSNEYVSDVACQDTNLRRYSPGSILMAMYGQGQTRGRVAVLNIEATVNQACAAISVKNVNNRFLFYQLMHMYEGIRKLSNVGSQKNLNIDIVKNIKIAVPSCRSQRRIVEILQIYDEKLLKQEKLIKGKSEQKKWLMQNLLTEKGHQLSSDIKWRKIKLKKVCSVVKGEQVRKEDLSYEGPYYMLNGGIQPSGYTERWNCKENTISISEGGNSCGYVNYNEEKFWSGGHCYTLQEMNENIVTQYLYQYLKWKEDKIMNLRVGSGLPNIQKKALEMLIIEIPQVKEQKAIAQVLTTADKEIELLEKQLEQIKLEKKAMMQLLLTGIVRVDKD